MACSFVWWDSHLRLKVDFYRYTRCFADVLMRDLLCGGVIGVMRFNVSSNIDTLISTALTTNHIPIYIDAGVYSNDIYEFTHPRCHSVSCEVMYGLKPGTNSECAFRFFHLTSTSLALPHLHCYRNAPASYHASPSLPVLFFPPIPSF